MDLLHEGKRDKSLLKREMEVMKEKRAARKEKTKYLLQEIEMLKETLTSVRKNKDVSIRRLESELERLREIKRASLNDERELKSEEVLVRPQRASVSSVPVLDNRKYRRQVKERAKSGDEVGKVWSAQSPRRRRSSYGTRRAHSTRKEIKITQDKIEAAAQAFLDIFGQLRPNVINSLWRKSSQTEEKGDESILDISRLGQFLHELVVHAFKHDNPDHPVPSVRRTRPLVSSLKLRLAPYVEDKNYLDIEHFKMFAFWLEKPAIAQQQGDYIVKTPDKLTAIDIDRRRQLIVGSECQIWSESLGMWCQAEIIKIKFDEQGEWLVVRYNDGSTDKEVQRYSKLLKVPQRVVSETM